MVFSLSAESYIMRSIACNLLEYSILIYTAQSRKLEKCITFIKIQNSWGGVQFNIIIPPNIFCIELVNISSENTSYFMLEDSIWLQLIYFSTTIAFWFVKYLFSNLWGHSKLTTSECWRIMKLWKWYYSIASITFDCFTTDEPNWLKTFLWNHVVPGLFSKMALETKLKHSLLKITPWKLHLTLCTYS